MRPKVTRSMLSTRLEQEIALSVGLPPPSQNRTLLPMQLTSQTKLLQSVSRGEEQHPPFRGSLRLSVAFHGDRVFTFSSLLAVFASKQAVLITRGLMRVQGSAFTSAIFQRSGAGPAFESAVEGTEFGVAEKKSHLCKRVFPFLEIVYCESPSGFVR